MTIPRVTMPVWFAMQAVKKGATLSAAAREFGCSLRGLRYAMRRLQKDPQPAINPPEET